MGTMARTVAGGSGRVGGRLGDLCKLGKIAYRVGAGIFRYRVPALIGFSGCSYASAASVVRRYHVPAMTRRR